MRDVTLSSATLSIPAISCAHCARAIESALAPVAGVQSVSVDVPGHTVELSYDPGAVELDRISGILAEEGYPVASIDVPNGPGAR